MKKLLDLILSFQLMSVREEFLGHEPFLLVQSGTRVFAFVGRPYENTDPRGGLTCALRTRKSGIITLDVASRRLTVDVLSARQARDIPRILPGFVLVARHVPRCAVGTSHRSRSIAVRRERVYLRDAAKNDDERSRSRIFRQRRSR